ncbi:hypothetical protein B5C26_20945, partial [Photorhabdus luminescens]|uniref:hypothetical protein n=1 Tax=Photorhabdus luminescens TaxID=29488 RepID=UPI000B6E9355
RGFLAGKFGEAVFLTWRQAPSGERNFIKTKCRIKNQHFVNNLTNPNRLVFLGKFGRHERI